MNSNSNRNLESVFRKIDQFENEAFSLLSQLIKFNTTDPPAGNCSEAQSWLGRYLREKVRATSTDTFEDFPGDPHLVSVFKSKANNGHSITFNGHIDVAEVRKDERWTFGPFEPTLKDGLVFGRGTADMKSGLTSMIIAIRAIRDCGLELNGDVIFESVCGEEAGEAGTKTCIERSYRSDFAVVSEPTDFMVQGQGGVITAWLTIKSPETFHDGVRRLMIHAGGGLVGASAIEKMVKIITALQELERHWAVTKSHPKMPAGSTTINPSVIQGGRHPAFIADECKLWLTIHMLPGETYSGVTRELEDYVSSVAEADLWLRDNPPKFVWGGKSMFRDMGEIFPSADVQEDSLAIKTLLQAHKFVAGKPTTVSIMSSVTDAGWFSESGIPVAIYGPGSLRQAHTVDEYIKWQDVMRATKVFAKLLLDWCGCN